MNLRNTLALVLTVVSLGLLIPGLTQPVLTIVASINMMGLSQELFRQTQSVLQAVRTLHESGNDFVAALILFFSVTVPFLKALALVVILAIRNQAARHRLYLMVRSLSKWAMADVFAVGVFIAFLAAEASDNLQGIPGAGFYYFAAYCLISNLAFQMLFIAPPPPSPAASSTVS
ncbi:MAG TPA: paraquat-inducible protein A [Gemmatimonadaceae bacterium]